MAPKAYFYEKVSETLIEDNVGKGYNCLCDLFSISNILIKFPSLHMKIMLPKIFLPVTFTKVVTLGILADAGCLWYGV